MIGLVFYPPSPRFASPEVADKVAAFARSLPQKIKIVGLFVNATTLELAESAQRYGLDYLQLSGDETPEACRVAAQLRPVIKSIRIPAQAQVQTALETVAPFAELDNLTLLLDAHKAGMYGGTGERNNWEVAQEIASRWPILLAGGLTPQNVAEAVQQVRPWGVDVSSGVEQDGAPGVKDLEKIRQFVAQALGIV
jgi:phosphoribosylanthranilate isomerase